MTFRVSLTLATLLITLAACSWGSGPPGSPARDSPSPPSPSAPAPAQGSTAARCHARGSGDLVLPDPSCTPGAADPRVTQATIKTTICRPGGGWSSIVRPPSDYTNKLERQQIVEYNLRDSKGNLLSQDQTEEDHLIALEIGGAPTNPQNLWPQYPHSPNRKDRVENKAHDVVCAHPEQLSQVQHAMASDWVTYGKQLGVL